MKRLFIIFHGRFPSEKAAALFAAKDAEAFADFFDTTLLVPRRLGREKQDPHEFYGLQKEFKTVFLPTLDVFPVPFLKRCAFLISHMFFSCATLLYLAFTAKRDDIIYSNENLSLLLASLFFKNCFYEMHDFPQKKSYRFYRFFLRRMKGVVIHNNWKVNQAIHDLSVDPTKILCELNAVDIEEFALSLPKSKAREMLSLPQHAKIAVYTGHLYGWKGVDTLAQSAGLIPEVSIYFVGGTKADIESFTKKYGGNPNIHIVGHKPHAEMPLWQKAADVLVLPNTAKEMISKYYTSPMKLFEYMASEVPIVASRIPSVEEIVSDIEAYFFTADDPTSLANTLLEALSASDVDLRTKAALQKAENHTWQKRAERIVSFIKAQ